MPSSATITAFYSFTANTKARASQVNSNFNIFRGHIIPVDPTTTGSATNTYDLGSSEWRWRIGFFRYLDLHSSTTTGARLQIQGDVAATLGSFVFQINSTTVAQIGPSGFNSLYFNWTTTSAIPGTALASGTVGYDRLAGNIQTTQLAAVSTVTVGATTGTISSTSDTTLMAYTFYMTANRPVFIDVYSANTSLFIRTSTNDGTEHGTCSLQIGGVKHREHKFGYRVPGTSDDSSVSLRGCELSLTYIPTATGNTIVAILAKKGNAGFGSLTFDQCYMKITQ